jgi:hypothetical protein
MIAMKKLFFNAAGQAVYVVNCSRNFAGAAWAGTWLADGTFHRIVKGKIRAAKTLREHELLALLEKTD